jgi:hypothetical protein
MAFRWFGSSGSRVPTVIANHKLKASTTFTHGVSVRAVSGRWQPCTVQESVGGIYEGPTITSGANDVVDITEVTPLDLFEVDYTGTPDAAFLFGQGTADCDTDGLNLNAADVTSGSWAIIKVDTTNEKAIVRCKNRQFS